MSIEKNAPLAEFLTPGQIGHRWSMHPESIRRLIRDGKIRSLVIGRRRLVRRSAVELLELEAEVK